MDSRITLTTNESFAEILESAFQQKEIVNLLLDDNGITRAAGKITAIRKTTSSLSIEFENGREINLKNIVAVNGVFRPEYGEC